MIEVSIIGTGALARNLYHAFIESDQVHLQIIGRSKEALQFFTNSTTTTDFKKAKLSEVILLAVSDSAIKECEAAIGVHQSVIAHCAGSFPLNNLTSENAGVFYPLQTYNDKSFVNFDSVPVLLEAKNKKTFNALKNLASILSTDVRELDSNKRKEAHLAAVFANNFSNYLFGVSKELLTDFELPGDLLNELILQTAKNAVAFDPKMIQSGPARRKDLETIEEHLKMIKDPNHKKRYEQLSNAIKDLYNEL